MAAILAHAEVKPLLSGEHFSVDGTLIKAWASMKSFQPKADTAPPDQVEGPDDPLALPSPPSNTTAPKPSHIEIEPMPRKTSRNRSAQADFRGHKRSNSTNESVTDPQARLY